LSKIVREASAVLLLYVAVVLLYGTARVQGRARLSVLEQTRRNWIARVTALGSAGLAAWLWGQAESGPAAALVAVVALMVMGGAVTLLGPVAPRLVWALALLAASVAPVLALLGAIY
jgi:uncharacterized membrane protein